MHYYGDMWPMWGLMMLFWLGVIALVVWAVVSYRKPHSRPDETASAERILAERYARGELDTEEYTRRLEALRAARGG